METPEQIKPHAADYKENAWQQYTAAELAAWVHLLRKRATHRTDEVKREKDLYDASNYEAMLTEKVGEFFAPIFIEMIADTLGR